MDTTSTLYEHEDIQAVSFIDVPAWVEQDITAYDIASIYEGGCASGAYMPAVTYSSATATMARYGDEVLGYIQDATGELPAPPDDVSWSGLACHYLSAAVETWAADAAYQLAAAIEALPEPTTEEAE